MSFSSPIFLFYFLPIFILLYFLIPKKFKKYFLFAGSIFFYIWGEPIYFPLILLLILVNYKIGISIEKKIKDGDSALFWLISGICLNILTLLYFKASDNLPLGLSFITFQFIAFLIDIHKQRSSAAHSIFDFASYILVFPKIVAGPIISYRQLNGKLNNPNLSLTNLAEGLRRFSVGLAKKVIIADALSKNINLIFALPQTELTSTWAWLGIISFTVQIYFDFSGYSDMAIGLAKALGFNLPENFNFPYISRSITEFWRRWHITLSNWFRDYVFYPLERYRRTKKIKTQVISILVVFYLTGLWHGLKINFILWGLLQGILIVFEQSNFGKQLQNSIGKPLQHIYSLFIIIFGWVLFRTSNLNHARYFFLALLGFGQGNGHISFYQKPIFETDFWITLFIGIFFFIPQAPIFIRLINKYKLENDWRLQTIGNIIMLLLTFISTTYILSSVSNISIYAKF